MAAVNLAACKIAGILFGLERWQTLLLSGCLNVVFAAYAGLWGVLVIDMIQFWLEDGGGDRGGVFRGRSSADFRRPARPHRQTVGATSGLAG